MEQEPKENRAGCSSVPELGYATFQVARGGTYGIITPEGCTLAESIRSAVDARDIVDELNKLREKMNNEVKPNNH